MVTKLNSLGSIGKVVFQQYRNGTSKRFKLKRKEGTGNRVEDKRLTQAHSAD